MSRLTPGTNLLALYAQLGHRIGGWWLALQAVLVGAGVPAIVAVAVAYLYQHSTSSAVTSTMAGARAGGIAVFLGAAVRLIRPQIEAHPRLGAPGALIVVALAWLLPINLFAILAGAGLAGAWLLRPRT